MSEDMFTHHYYKQRCIIKPSPLAKHLVHGIVAGGLLFTCISLLTLLQK